MIGSALVTHLRAQGHQVLRLVRRRSTAPDEVTWDPVAGTVDVARLTGTEAVIHLAGAGVGDHRWTDDYKREILTSRVDGTATIVRAITQLDPKPSVLVAGSAIGWYGDTGDRAVTESDPAGTGFLADVVRAWEAAADPAAQAGIRVVHARTGLVVAKAGGAWAKLFPLFRLGLGGKMGSGRQYWSWISLRDELAALEFLMNSDHLTGPVNLTAPMRQPTLRSPPPWVGCWDDQPCCRCPASHLGPPSANSQLKSSAVSGWCPRYLNPKASLGRTQISNRRSGRPWTNALRRCRCRRRLGRTRGSAATFGARTQCLSTRGRR